MLNTIKKKKQIWNEQICESEMCMFVCVIIQFLSS